MRREVGCAILAGGMAARLGGGRKGEIELSPGVTIVGRLVAEVRRAGVREVVLSGVRGEADGKPRLPVVPDLFEGCGPIGGMHAALSYFAGRCDAVLFLPCDMPCLSFLEIGRLLDAFRRARRRLVAARTPGRGLHPVCAVIGVELRGELERAVRERRLKLTALWEALDAESVFFHEEERFININTPEDLESYRRLAGGRDD